MKKIFSGVIVLIIILSLSFSLGKDSYVLAAQPGGTLTGTVIALDVTETKAITAITVTDTVPEITAINEICIRINAATNAAWDQTDTTATIANTGVAVVDPTVSYPDNKTLLLNVTNGFGAGDTVVVSDLSYMGYTAPTAGAVLTWAIDNADCSLATYKDGNVNTAITVNVAPVSGWGTTVSGDTTVPISTITIPTAGTTITAGQPYTIKGTAVDDMSLVKKIEISLDGGNNWQTAEIKSLLANVSSWEYVWQDPTAGSYTIKSRATDGIGNREVKGDEVTVTVVAPTPEPSTPELPTLEKPVAEMTAQELEAKITEVRQTILDLLKQLVQVLQQQIQQLQ